MVREAVGWGSLAERLVVFVDGALITLFNLCGGRWWLGFLDQGSAWLG
jgi:hypothetical protein